MISAGMALEDSSIVTALDMYEEAYNEALQVSDVELLRDLHLRKGLLLLRNGLAEESIEEMYEAFHIDSLRHDTIDMIYTARYMAFAYESMGQLEHARGEISRVIHFPIIPNNSLQLGIEHDYHDRMLTLQKRLESLPSAKENEMPQITPKSTEVELAFFGWQAEQQGDVGNALSWYEKLRTKSSAAFQAFPCYV